jgi:hypothetical protein
MAKKQEPYSTRVYKTLQYYMGDQFKKDQEEFENQLINDPDYRNRVYKTLKYHMKDQFKKPLNEFESSLGVKKKDEPESTSGVGSLSSKEIESIQSGQPARQSTTQVQQPLVDPDVPTEAPEMSQQEFQQIADTPQKEYPQKLAEAAKEKKNPLVKDILLKMSQESESLGGGVLKTLADVVPGEDDVFARLAEQSDDLVASYNEQATRGNQSISQQWSEGNKKGAVEEAVVQMFGQAPQLVVLGTTGGSGLGIVGTSVYGQKYDELKEVDQNDFVKRINALTTAAAEVGSEALTTLPLLNSAKKAVMELGEEAARPVVQKSLNKVVQDFFASTGERLGQAASESLSEMTAQEAENIIDYVTGVKEEYTPFGRQTVDAGIVGLLTGAGVSVPGTAADIKKAVNSIPDKYSMEEKVELTEKITKKNKLEDEVKNIDPAFKKEIQGKELAIENLNKQINDIKPTENPVEALSDQDKGKIPETEEKQVETPKKEEIDDAIQEQETEEVDVRQQTEVSPEVEQEVQEQQQEVEPKIKEDEVQEEVQKEEELQQKEEEIDVAFNFAGSRRFGKITEKTDDQIKVVDQTGARHTIPIKGKGVTYKNLTTDPKQATAEFTQQLESNKQEVLAEIDKREISKQRKEASKQKISEGFDELMSAIGGVKKAVGDTKPDVARAIKNIAEGVFELGSQNVEEFVGNVKRAMKKGLGFDDERLDAIITQHLDTLNDVYNKQTERGKARTKFEDRIKEPRVESESIQDVDFKTIKSKVDDFAKGVKGGKKFTEQEIKNVQQQVTEYIKNKIPSELLNKDPIRKRELGKINTLIKNAKTNPAGVQQAFQKIEDIVLDKNKKATRKSIDKKINKIKPRRERGMTKQTKFSENEYDLAETSSILYQNDGKRAKNKTQIIDNLLQGQVTENQRNLLEAQKEALDFVNSKDIAEVERNGMVENIEDWSEKDAYKYTLLGMVGSDNMTLGELNEINNELGYLIDTGRTKRKAKKDIEKAEKNELKQNILNTISSGKELQTEAQKAKNKSTIESFVNALKNFRAANESLQTLFEFMSRNDKNSTPFTGVLHDLANDVSAATTASKVAVSRAVEAARRKADDIFGDSSTKKLKENSKEKNLLLTVNGEKKAHKMSKDDAMHYLHIYESANPNEDPSIIPTFEKMGWDDVTISELYDFVTDNGKDKTNLEWMDWQVNEFYPSYYNRVNDVYRSRYGVNLPKVNFYVPMFRKAGKGDELTDLLNKGSRQFTSSSIKSSLKERVGNTNEFKKMGATDLMLGHITQMEHFINMTDVVSKMKSVFNDPAIRETINQQHGSNVNKIVDGFITDLEAGKTQTGLRVKWVDDIRRNFVYSKIGLNIPVFIKQLSSQPAYLSDIPVGQIPYYMSSFSNMLDNPKQAKQDFKDLLNTIKTRYDANTFIRELEEASSTARGLGAKKKSFKEWIMVTAKLGDAGAILAGGYPMFKTKQRMYEKTMPKEAARKKALNDFSRVTRLTQQAGEIPDLSHIQRWGSIGKMATLFQTAPFQYLRMEQAAITNLIKGRGNKVDNMKNFLIYHFVLPGMFQAASGLIGGTEKEDWIRTFALGSLAYAFIAGDAAEAVYDLIVKEKTWGLSFLPEIVEDELLDAIQSSKNIITDADDMTMDEIMRASNDGLNAIGTLTGVPIGNIGRYAEGIYDYSTGKTQNEMRMLGYSDWALGEAYLNNNETSIIYRTLNDNGNLSQALQKARDFYGDDFSKHENNIKKKYKIYNAFGFKNEDVNYLLKGGVSNEEKAEYLVDLQKDMKGKFFPYYNRLKSLKVVSDDTHKKYLKARKK